MKQSNLQRIFMIALTLCLLVSLLPLYTATASAAETNSASDYCNLDFETTTGLPEGWQWDNTNYVTVKTTADPTTASNHVLAISLDGSTTGNGQIAYPFSKTNVTGAILEYRFYYENGTTPKIYLPTFINVGFKGGSECLFWIENGRLKSQKGNYTSENLTNGWHTFKIDANFSQSSWKVSLDSSTETTLSITCAGSRGIFIAAPRTNSGNVYLDDLKVTSTDGNTIYCNQSFESVSGLPTDWSWYSDATFTTATVADPLSNANRVLCASGSAANAFAIYPFAKDVVTDAVLEYDFYAPENNNKTAYLPTFQTFPTGGGAKVFLAVGGTNSFSCVTDSYKGWNIATFDQTKWNHVKLVAHFSTGAYEVWLNGTKLGTSGTLNGSANVSTLFWSVPNSYTGKLYIDNLKVSPYVEPTVSTDAYCHLDFENNATVDQTTNLPTGWSNVRSTNETFLTEVLTDATDSSNHVLKVYGDDTHTGGMGAYRFTTTPVDGAVLEYRFRRSDDQKFTMYLPSFMKNGAEDVHIFLYIGTDGKLHCNYGSYQYLTTIPSGWNTVKLVADFKNSVCDLYFNDEKLLSVHNIKNLGTSNSICMNANYSSGSTGEVYLDDITVSPFVPVTEVSGLTLESNAIFSGQTTQANLTYAPETASMVHVTYTSSNTAVATVDSFGVVTGVGGGTTTITATCKVGTATVEKTAELTVTKASVARSMDFESDADLTAWQGTDLANTRFVLEADEVDPDNHVLTMETFRAEATGYDPLTASEVRYTLPLTLADSNNESASIRKAVLKYRFNVDRNSNGNQSTNWIYLPNFATDAGETPVSLACHEASLEVAVQSHWMQPLVKSIGNGQWYELEWMVDLDKGVYDLYLDGELIVNNAQFAATEKTKSAVWSVKYDETTGAPIWFTHNDGTDATIKKTTSSITGINMGISKATNAGVSIDDLQILDYEPATSWKLADNQLKNVAVGNTLALELEFTTASGKEASCRSAKIESSDTSVAVIDYNGNIIGKKPGKTIITITPNETGLSSQAIDVWVLETISATDITNVSDMQLPEGGHQFIDGTIIPANASAQTLTYASSNEAVASVDQWGEIVAHKAGTAVITVSAGTYSETMTVTVNEPGVMQTINVTDAASLLSALDTISNLDKSNMTGNIVVNLSEGYYQLADTLKLNETHGGNGEYSVIFKGTGDVTIGGGLQIAGSSFTLDKQTGIYSFSVPAGTKTRQLFVDNVRATRARSEENLAFTELTENGVSKGVILDLPELATYKNQDAMELVLRYSFPHFRVGVDHIEADGTSVKLYMDQPGWTYAQADILHAKSGGHTLELLYIENALELLDEPGEWYLDESSSTLYYMPRDFEDMSQVTITLPVVDGLLSIEGTTPETAVQNISFENITFADATWMRPSTKDGYSLTQNSAINEYVDQIHFTYMPEGSVTVKWANSVNFTGCTFTRLGSTALYLENGVQNCSITENKVYDCSGVGIQIGDVPFGHMAYPQINNYNPTDRNRLLKNITVENNYIHDIGVDYKSSAGIGLAFAANVTISHNEIFNVPYSGMHVGYGWNTRFDNMLVNAEITCNYIHDYLLVMNDGGGIYTLGNTGGTAENPNVIANNYLSYIWNANAPIYHDNGSSFWHDYENVIDVSNIDYFPTGIVTPAWTFINTYSHDLWQNDNYATTGRSQIASGNTSNLNVGTPTVVADGNWTGKALEIVNAAGLNTSKAAALRNGHAEVIVENIPDTLELSVNQTFEAEVSFMTGRREALNANASIYYAVDDPTLASVDENGKLTALKNGATTLRVYVLSNDILTEYTCQLYIGAELEKVQLRNVENNSITQTIAGPKTYEAYGISGLGNELTLDSVKFEIADTSIAKVNSRGKITPVAIGETTLTVTGSIGEASVSQTFTLKITDVDGGKIAYGTPTLDGVLDDVYLNSTKITLGDVFYPKTTSVTDTNGYAYLAWDDDYLYCYIYVEDGDVVSKGKGDITDLYNWTTDAVETFVTMKTKGNPNGRQVKFAMDAFGLGVYTEGGIGEDVEALAATLPYFTAFTYNGKIVENYKIDTPTMNQKAGTDEQPVNGYVIEMTLPIFTDVNDPTTVLHGGDQIDFQIQVNDYDGGGTDNSNFASKVVARHNAKAQYYLMSGPEKPVDKTALNTAIETADALDLSEYQDGTEKDAFETALTHAKTVSADADAEQSEVNAALAVLNKAQSALKPVPIDKTALKAAIDAAEAIDLSKYQNGAEKDAFVEALAAAKTIYAKKNASQTEVDNATKVLTETRDGLKRKSGTGIISTIIAAVSGRGEHPFTDVSSSDWYNDDVQFVYEEGLMDGVSSRRFAPDATVTRAMVATILWRMEGEPAAKSGTDFTDVEKNQWYSEAVAWTAQNGIFGGYGNGLFGTNDAITREQLATILYRYAQYKSRNMSVSGSLSAFADGAQVSAFAADAMQWCVGAGLLNGSNGKLNPTGTATRTELAAILHRFAK